MTQVLTMHELYEKAMAGDSEAEKQLFERLLVRFKHFAKQHMQGEDADDVAQEACLTILSKYKEQAYEKSFEAWAHGVLKMKIGNHFQHLAGRRKNIAGAEDVENLTDNKRFEDGLDLKRRLRSCLKKINQHHPRYLRALNLVQHGYTTDEICRMMRVKPNYFYVILNRGRKMLKECLKQGGM
jgi:RNA polymerase sigma factor (sigma-70 family)